MRKRQSKKKTTTKKQVTQVNTANTQNTRHYFNYWPLFLLIAATITGYLLYDNSQATPTLPFDSNDPCHDFFTIEYNHGQPISMPLELANIVLLGESHGQNIAAVAACLSTLAKPQDHLLLETAPVGELISCDAIQPHYHTFNKQLLCYGADIGIDNNRRLAALATFNANAIKDKINPIAQTVRSSKELADFIEKVLVSFIKHTPKTEFDPAFNDNAARYFLQLAKNLEGLSLPLAKAYLIQENNQQAKLANEYLQISRYGSTNAVLTQEIKNHVQQNQTAAHPFKLFMIYGHGHFEKSNQPLQEFLKETDLNVAVLQPKGL